MTESNERHTGWSGACLACGTSWEIHDSPLITCNKLQVELHNKRALEAYIEKLEARCKRLEANRKRLLCKLTFITNKKFDEFFG